MDFRRYVASCGAEHYTFDENFLDGYVSNTPNGNQRFDLNRWV